MSEPIRILIVDDHLALRIGLAAMVSSHSHLKVVADAADNSGAIAACAEHRPEVVLMDLRLPGGGGVDATSAIRRRWPATRVLIVTTFDGDEDIHRAIEAGASGYLLKGLSSAELVAAIAAVHRGKTVMPPASPRVFVSACCEKICRPANSPCCASSSMDAATRRSPRNSRSARKA